MSELEKGIDQYFIIFEKVRERARSEFPELSVSDIKDIATHLNIGFQQRGIEITEPDKVTDNPGETKTAGAEPKGKLPSDKQMYVVNKALEEGKTDMITKHLEQINRRLPTNEEINTELEDPIETQETGHHCIRSWEISKLIDKIKKGEQ